jgi:hypothetical protein
MGQSTDVIVRPDTSQRHAAAQHLPSSKSGAAHLAALFLRRHLSTMSQDASLARGVGSGAFDSVAGSGEPCSQPMIRRLTLHGLRGTS